MDNISYIENDNSLVILLNKKNLDSDIIDKAKRFFMLQNIDTSHIPYVSPKEQEEIEKLLQEPESNEFIEKTIIDL